jgi:hypothetical protein
MALRSDKAVKEKSLLNDDSWRFVASADATYAHCAQESSSQMRLRIQWLIDAVSAPPDQSYS